MNVLRCVIVAVVMMFFATIARAQSIETSAGHAILIDAQTGAVLFEKNADERIHPASMSKLMTVYMLFDQLAGGSVKLSDTFPVSQKAWRTQGSKMFVAVNSRVAVEDLIRGIVVQSGNDACVVVAEGLASSEASFAEEMTRKAKALGMQNTVLKNASGWPEDGHVMSVRDLAVLSQRLIKDFPQFYSYFSEKEFVYNNIRQGNRNPLLYKALGADGLKTGHIEEAGYGLAASAIRSGRRLILIVHGFRNVNERSREAERLLEWGFREFDNYKLFAANESVADADVWLGTAAKVPLYVKDELVVTMPKKSRRGLKVAVVYDSPIPSPIAKDAVVARLQVTIPDGKDLDIPLHATNAVAQLNTFGRIGAAARYLIWGSGGTAR